MEDQKQEITITVYQSKCEFCGQKFTELKPHLAEVKRNSHMYNDCPVLRCLSIIKDIEYPIKAEDQSGVS